jgi:hypothetical protein
VTLASPISGNSTPRTSRSSAARSHHSRAAAARPLSPAGPPPPPAVWDYAVPGPPPLTPSCHCFKPTVAAMHPLSALSHSRLPLQVKHAEAPLYSSPLSLVHSTIRIHRWERRDQSRHRCNCCLLVSSTLPWLFVHFFAVTHSSLTPLCCRCRTPPPSSIVACQCC